MKWLAYSGSVIAGISSALGVGFAVGYLVGKKGYAMEFNNKKTDISKASGTVVFSNEKPDLYDYVKYFKTDIQNNEEKPGPVKVELNGDQKFKFITSKEFLNSEDGYTQKTLCWFINDKKLVDLTDGKFDVLDTVPTIGEEAYRKLLETEDLDDLYILDNDTLYAYEIVSTNDDFENYGQPVLEMDIPEEAIRLFENSEEEEEDR